MRPLYFSVLAMTSLAAVAQAPAAAQGQVMIGAVPLSSTTTIQTGPRVPSPDLPEPALSPDASPADFLRAARGALSAGRFGETQSALEMAQTRLLSRTVDAGLERLPSDDPAVRQITGALAALSVKDRVSCLRYIEVASQSLGTRLN